VVQHYYQWAVKRLGVAPVYTVALITASSTGISSDLAAPQAVTPPRSRTYGAPRYSSENTIPANRIAFPPNLTGLFNNYRSPGFPPIFTAQKPENVVKKLENHNRALIITNSDALGEALDEADLPWVYLEFERVSVIAVDKGWHGVNYPDRFKDLEIKSRRW
jgi:hypothetical protein